MRLFVITLLAGLTVFASTFAAAQPFNQRPDVQAYIKELSQHDGFDTAYLNHLFSKVHLLKRVKNKMAHPYEANPWAMYQQHFLTPNRITGGVAYWHKHHKVLQQVEQQYHVPAEIIIAIIGVESNYGKRKGGFPTLNTLSTMAFDYPYRRAFFRNELTQFLLMTREQHFNPWQVYGSYAGAIGQPQFMPSSYRAYAVDFSGGKHADLMNNDSDVIASVANYFAKNGWHAHGKICQRSEHDQGNLTLHGQHGIEHWQTFHNFAVIKRYNTSDLYALAVYQLSRQIAKRYHRPNIA